MTKNKSVFTKPISIILSLIIVITSLSSAAVFTTSAAQTEGVISFDESFYLKNKDACDKVADGIKNLEQHIDISDCKLSTGDVSELMYVVTYRNPGLFYVTGACSYYISGNYATVIVPKYSYSTSEIEEKQQTLDSVIDKYLALVDNSMSDFQKAVILHDELVLRTEYAYDPSMYNILTEGKGQCIAYAFAYARLLSLVGIDSEIISSAKMNHAWLKVKIDGEYYNVDPTWDDPIADKPGHVQHTYFLYSDEAFQSGTNFSAHTDYESYYPATSKKYDNYDMLHRLNTRLCYSDGTFFAIDNKYKSEYEKCMIKYDETNDSATVVNKFNARWSAGGTSYWVGGYMSLDECDKILYCNTDNKIYYYDIKTGELNEYTTDAELNGKCYGLLIKDNQVYAVIADNPNTTASLVLAGDCIKREPDVILGDVNGDGVLTIADATLIQKYLANIVSLDSKQLAAADVNQDGTIDVIDVTKIQMSLV